MSSFFGDLSEASRMSRADPPSRQEAAEYKKIQRSMDGPGGIKCNCCRIGSVKEHKAMSNRLVRRSMNMNPQDIRNAHEEYEQDSQV